MDKKLVSVKHDFVISLKLEMVVPDSHHPSEMETWAVNAAKDLYHPPMAGEFYYDGSVIVERAGPESQRRIVRVRFVSNVAGEPDHG